MALEPRQQGEVWRIEVSRRTVTVVIVDATPIIQRRTLLTVVQVRDPDELPQGVLLLAVPVADPVKGVIAISDLHVYGKHRFVEFLGRIDDDTMDAVKAVLRARFDL